jgi:spore maturation protein CgeB
MRESRAAADPLFDIYLSFAGGADLDRLEREFGARGPLPLYCSVDRTLPADRRGAALGSRLSRHLQRRPAARARAAADRARAPPARPRFVVAGPQYPDDIDWPGNVERIEHLPPPARLLLQPQRFTLNVTRADMIAGGHGRPGAEDRVRLFEAAACGTPIISDRATRPIRSTR